MCACGGSQSVGAARSATIMPSWVSPHRRVIARKVSRLASSRRSRSSTREEGGPHGGRQQAQRGLREIPRGGCGGVRAEGGVERAAFAGWQVAGSGAAGGAADGAARRAAPGVRRGPRSSTGRDVLPGRLVCGEAQDGALPDPGCAAQGAAVCPCGAAPRAGPAPAPVRAHGRSARRRPDRRVRTHVVLSRRPAGSAPT